MPVFWAGWEFSCAPTRKKVLTMPDQDRVIIVGGGIIGLSLAYHLAHLGACDVVLLERNKLTSGTTWHAAGIVGPMRATYGMTKLAMQAMTAFAKLENETGLKTGYQRTMCYWIARRDERMDELVVCSRLGIPFTRGV